MKTRQGFAAALLLAATTLPVAALAQYGGQGYQNDRNGGYRNQGGRRTEGTIASVNGGNVRLTDGRNIFLQNGTVINPRGTTLRPGQRISVMGSRGGNGAINATEIDMSGSGGGGRHHHHYNGNGYNGNGNNGYHGGGGGY